MSKIISQDKVTEKFAHFTDVHFKESICVNMDSFEGCIYVLGRKFRISRYVCTAIDENGGVIPLNLDNLTIAVKPKYADDFVGYVNINEVSVKISIKYPYNYNHLFVFAFVCDNVALKVLLTKPVTSNANLSGMSVDIGIKDSNINTYDKVMEDISAIASLLKSTALRNVESGGTFAGFFEPLSALPCKGSDNPLYLTKEKEYDNYDNGEDDYYV